MNVWRHLHNTTHIVLSPWGHLTNAQHIDRVLASSKTHPEIWGADPPSVRTLVHYKAYDKAYNTVCDTFRIAAWNDAARTAALGMSYDAVRNAAYDATRGAALALVAYDDAAKCLTMPSEQLKTWAFLSEDPAAILLLPAVIAFERISELETA